MNFIAFELEEPVTKQYLENCVKNATYDSHKTLTLWLNPLMNIWKKEIDEKLCNASDIVIYSDEATSAARKEMMGLSLGCFHEIEKEFMLDYVFSWSFVDQIWSFVRQNHKHRYQRHAVLLFWWHQFNVSGNLGASKAITQCCFSLYVS